jgi:hypothetical protein
MSKGTKASTDLIPLNVPVPPMLAKAIGYRREAQFVSFQWTPYGDEADYSDGRTSATGNWQAFLAFIHHPAVSPQLKGYDLGSSDSEAKHALILDQEQHVLYVAPVREAEKFLQKQWPEEQPTRMSQEEYPALVMKALKNVKPPTDVSMEEVQRRIDQQYALIEELQQWLDKQLKN